MRNFSDLTEREVLALAIANEEEDGRIYADIAEGLRDDYAATANLFSEMGAEEGEHRRLHPAKAGLADPPARPRLRAPTGRGHGGGDIALLSASRGAHHRCLDP